MSNQFQALQRRFGNSRPGLQLVAVEDAALPVTVLRAEVLAQERKKLAVTEEYLLRFVGLGVDTPEQIAAYLGLETSHVLDAAAAQLGEQHVRRGPTNQLQLTSLGTEVVRNLVASQPVIQQLPVTFDRLTWTVADYPDRALIEKRHAEELGMVVLPGTKNATIEAADVSPGAMNSLLKDGRVEVLRVHRVSVRKHRYLPVKLLVFGDPARHEIELAVCIDDDLSPEHGMALDRAGAADKLKLSLVDAEPRPLLDEELERIRSTDGDELPFVANQPAAVGTSQVKSVRVHEHADLLSEALESAQSRLLIMSPWVRGSVVNQDFENKLEQRLRSGIPVTIAHGIGDDDKGSDPRAIERLEKLAGRYKNLNLARLKNTHAKILIFDGNWINTSFNWLSFRGDPNRTYRMEEGTLVRVPDRVEKEYVRYLQMIEDQRLR